MAKWESYQLTILATGFLTGFCACAQNPADTRLVGGPCEGCEAVFEYGDRELTATDTLPGFDATGPKMKISGTVYRSDGETPASDVILYVYHTDQGGLYPAGDGPTVWARRHGQIRTWLKTDEQGRYTFYTLKPGAYPQGTAPAHIHITVLEPDGKYYWINEYLFEGDPLIRNRTKLENNPRGGHSGVIALRQENGWLVGARDVVLGANITPY